MNNKSKRNQQPPKPFGSEQNQIVNEQDQQEKINPSGDMQKGTEKNLEQEVSRKEEIAMDKGNSYKDDPRRGEEQLPRN